MTYQRLQKLGQQILEQAGVPEAALDARLLLEWACAIDRSTLLAHGDREADSAQEAKYLAAIAKRADRIPLQHLTGVQDFMGLTFEVNENVLIPRQDTEILVEEVMKDLHGGSAILDLCTGSGCILISLLKYSNECHGVGVDLSPAALEVASRNAQKLIPDRDCTFICGDLFENVTGKFDILTSNPPYIPTAIVDTLMPEVRDHEPRLALDGTADGLHFYRRILKECKSYLNKGAMIFFEIGYDQGPAVSELMEQAGCLEVRIIKDYAGLDRVVTGVYSPKDGL